MQSKKKKSLKKGKPVHLEIEGEVVDGSVSDATIKRSWGDKIYRAFRLLCCYPMAFLRPYALKILLVGLCGGVIFMGWWFWYLKDLSDNKSMSDHVFQDMSLDTQSTQQQSGKDPRQLGVDQKEVIYELKTKIHDLTQQFEHMSGLVKNTQQSFQRVQNSLKDMQEQQNDIIQSYQSMRETKMNVPTLDFQNALQDKYQLLQNDMKIMQEAIRGLKSEVTQSNVSNQEEKTSETTYQFVKFYFLYHRLKQLIFSGQPYVELLTTLAPYIKTMDLKTQKDIKQYALTGFPFFSPLQQKTLSEDDSKKSHLLPQQIKQSDLTEKHSEKKAVSFSSVFDAITRYSQNFVSIKKRHDVNVVKDVEGKILQLKLMIQKGHFSAVQRYIREPGMVNILPVHIHAQLDTSLRIKNALDRIYQEEFSAYFDSFQ